MTGDQPKTRAVVTGKKDSVSSLAFISNEQLASAGSDNMVRLWDLTGTSPKETSVLSESEGRVRTLAVSPDGRLLASGGTRNEGKPDSEYPVFVYDVTQPRPRLLHSLLGHIDPARSLIFSNDSSVLYSTSIKETAIRAWDVSGELPKAKYQPSGHLAPLTSVAISHDGKMLATVGDGVRLWDLTGSHPVETASIEGHLAGFAPNGRYLVTSGGQNVPWLWDLRGPKPVGSPIKGSTGVFDFAFSPEGSYLAIGNNKEHVQIWDMTGDKPALRAELKEPIGNPKVVFSPDRKTLVTCSGDRKLRLWDLSEREPKLRSEVDTGYSSVHSIALSADGTLLASTHDGATQIAFWEMTGKHPRRREDIPLTKGLKAVFAANGQSLFVQNGTSTIAEFDLERNVEVRSWSLPGPVNDFTLSADGRYVVTANGNSTAYILCLDNHNE